MKFFIVTVLLGVLLTACGGGDADGDGGGDNGGGTQKVGTELLAPFYGNYNVTYTGRVGGEYQPTDSLVTGTTTGVVPFVITGGTVWARCLPQNRALLLFLPVRRFRAWPLKI